ncbi:hypothetical protein [Microvirga guangxiensis]|uniref:Uncharacterized protein n=1 Tax=Microvirga guangxiensis TaxID=549386 RepID=A0A1G5I355_9HYPH|nr:hypothetical protein [Microvirga guangxiensis]SCY70496.1 hypothetical protein SAMN02927923_02053 [Microvirga guangxiensis]
MMNAESEFEWKETYRARLNGLESVLAAIVELLASENAAMRKDLSQRLDLLQVLMREQNAHLASLEVVNRFQVLVSEEVRDPIALSWSSDS